MGSNNQPYRKGKFYKNFLRKTPTALLMGATGHSTKQMFQRYFAQADMSRAQTLVTYFQHITGVEGIPSDVFI